MTMINQDQVHALVVGVLADITQDWDLDLANGFAADTRLIADLAFESIDLVQFAVAIEQALGTTGLPFEKLFMKDGDYVEDLTLGEVVRFLVAQRGR